MNFDVSSSNFSTNIGTVSVSNGAKVNYKTKQFTVDEVDYSDSVVEVDPSLLDVMDAWHVSDDLLPGIYNWLSNGQIGKTNSGEFLVDKAFNAGFWAFSKGAVEGFFQNFGDGATLAVTHGSRTPYVDAIYKPLIAVFSCLILGKEIDWRKDVLGNAGAGFSKAATSNYLKDVVKKPIENTFKKLGMFGFEKIGSLLNNVDPELLKMDMSFLQMEKFLGHAGKIGSAIGIDYVASLASNYVKALITDGDVTIEDMKLGSTFLKSSTKEICGYAGSLIGGDVGKLVGTAVGAYVGELQVAVFTDEKGVVNEEWCAYAGAAQIGGAVVGAALAVFCLSNPVGWAVGLCILAGAAIGFLVTAVAYHWDNIVNAISNTAIAVGEWVSDALKTTGAWCANAYESIVDVATGIYETGAAMFTGVCKFASEVYNSSLEFIDAIGVAVQANPVSNFLIGWAF